MKKMLTKLTEVLYHYKNGVKIVGAHSKINGNVSYIRGDVSNISGNVSGISGNVSGISGDLNLCELTDEERKSGVLVPDLIAI